jgi:hypothetical protein
MAFTFSDTLTTDHDWIRLKAGDTIENYGPRPFTGSNRNFSDALIAAILSDEGHKVATVAALFEILAAEWGANKMSEREGEASRDAKEVADYYLSLANEWRAKENGGGGSLNSISGGVVDLDIAARGDDYPL